MRKTAKLLALAKALPVALILSGPSPQAMAFELDAANTVGKMGEQLSQGYLHAAQETLQQLHACNVHSVQLGETIVPLSAIGLALTGLAKGDSSLWLELEDVLLLANSGVRSLFITDVGPVGVCQVNEETFVASSSGPT